MNRYSVGYIQTGKEELVNDNKRYWIPRPLTDKGINGEGQIVCVLDTGLDINHNFFYDSEHKFEYNKFDPSQRKVVYYDTSAGDNRDHKEGHGTHVCGILLGKSWKNNSEASLYNGVAPEAKLYFFDLGKQDAEYIMNPIDDEDVANRVTSKGIGILSRSYGYDTPNETSSYIEDKIAWDHKDLLVVASAGNTGPDNKIGVTADAVNIITVGNVISPIIQGIDQYPDIYGVFTLINKEDQNKRVNLTALTRVIGIPTTKEGDLLDIDDINVSTSFEENAICLIQDEGNGSIEAGLKKAKENHCTFAVVENNAYKITYTFPTYMCSSGQFATLKEFKHAIYRANSTLDKYYHTGNISEYSSRGPTYAGVLKPDISAPGSWIFSAKSEGYDSKPTNDTSFNTLVSMGGTSMAAPHISGSATLFRQYFMQGWYPSGNPTKGDEFKPSSSLLKAALINSASSKRDNSMGHGIPNLQRGMGFDGYGVMFVNDQKIKPKEEQAYEINVTKEGQLYITLSYLDFPRYYSSFRTIVNPIHMRIECPNGTVSEPPEDQKSLSTNSKIMMTTTPGLHKLFITSTNYDNRSVEMQYCLAIMGEIKTQKLERSATSIQANCSKGTYKNGRCQCNDTLVTGTYCQTSILKFSEYDNTTNILPKDVIQWHKIDVNPNEKYSATFYGSSIDANIRFCISDEVDIDVNSRMPCYQLSHNMQNITGTVSSTGNIYVAFYPTKFTSFLEFVKYNSSAPAKAAKGNDNNIILIASLIALSILCVGLLTGFIIFCVIQRKKFMIRDESSQNREVNLI